MTDKQHLILCGAPGSGKGTQAVLLEREFGFLRFSTGDGLRAEIAARTDFAKAVERYVRAGELVPDDLIMDLVKRTLSSSLGRQVVFDGFPRTLAQAESLDSYLGSLGDAIGLVLQIDVDDEIIVQRLKGRRICSLCGAPTNLSSSPPRIEGVCDTCGGALVDRADDSAETIRLRLQIYRQETTALLEHYSEKGVLVHVDGRGSIEDVGHNIRAALRQSVYLT